jgi:hypothetical protein
MPPAKSGSREGCTFIALLAQQLTNESDTMRMYPTLREREDKTRGEGEGDKDEGDKVEGNFHNHSTISSSKAHERKFS